jgi:predicted nucleotide-binding protein (sugar kinase/HSP70/actin superfamily)
MPLVNYLYSTFHTKVQLYRMMKPLVKGGVSFFDVSTAYDRALAFRDSCALKLKDLYKRETGKTDDIRVVFIGRPYTILSQSMNSGIPAVFASLGIKTFYQDMLSYTPEDVESIEPLCNEIPWHYASEILKSAEFIAQSDGVYPVFVTSFKCSPDSFALEYFKQLMDFREKPYLILQLDGHSSRVGYETRIEAAVRSFRNHRASRFSGKFRQPVRYGQSLMPKRERELSGKTVIIPNWDELSLSLVVANTEKSAP